MATYKECKEMFGLDNEKINDAFKAIKLAESFPLTDNGILPISKEGWFHQVKPQIVPKSKTKTIC